MNKYSLIGMVLLVGMVLAKAYVSIDNSGDENLLSRSEEQLSANLTSDVIAADVNPTVQLFASNFTPPSLEDFASLVPLTNDVVEASFEINSNDLRPSNEEVAEEIRPMESYSNTGYGMWIGSSEEKETIEE